MTWEYLPPEPSTQLDSGTGGIGQKACLACNQFDCACGIVDTAFAPEVDVTGAAWCQTQCSSGRSHRHRKCLETGVSVTVTDSSVG